MTVSIIIPAYNAAGTIGLVLEALTHQTHHDFEVVIVDDASKDSTSAIARGYANLLNLTILQPPENLGRARARNYGIENSSGEIIILLDSDIETIPTYVHNHVKLHTEHTNTVGVGCLRYPSPLAKRALARYYSSRGGARLKPGESLPGKAFISCLASFRRSLFDEVGRFHEGFRVYGGEDLELGLRFQKKGASLTYLPEAVGYHHHLRPISEVIKTLEAYGEEGIPLVLKLHPDFAKEMKLDDLHFRYSNLQSILRSIISSPIIFNPALRFAALFEARQLPSPLITYLIYRSYRQGYSRYQRSTH